MNTALKKAINELFNLCDLNVSSSLKGKENTSLEKERLKTECIDYLSYLSASDGTISKYEAEFIAEYFNFNLSPEELRSYIDKNNTYTTEFENTTPQTLKLLIESDNKK